NPSPVLLRIRDRNGTNERVISDGKTPPPTNAVWSPDGTRIAYYAFDFETRTAQIYMMNADGTGIAKLSKLGPGDGRAGRPAGSPDGTRIAFHALVDNVDPK